MGSTNPANTTSDKPNNLMFGELEEGKRYHSGVQEMNKRVAL